MSSENNQELNIESLLAAIDHIDHIFIVDDARNISPEEMQAIREELEKEHGKEEENI